MECCRLRVKDVDRARGQLTVRGGKGASSPKCAHFLGDEVMPQQRRGG